MSAAAAQTVDRGLHVRLPQHLAARIRHEAENRGVRPFVLLGRALERILDDELLLNTLLGDMPAETITASQLELMPGLTRIQGAMLFVMAKYSDEFGMCFVATLGLAVAIPCSQPAALAAIKVLLERGLIAEAGGARPSNAPRIYHLTEAGWDLANLLGDFRSGAAR